jgi:hypothetical protein
LTATATTKEELTQAMQDHLIRPELVPIEMFLIDI